MTKKKKKKSQHSDQLLAYLSDITYGQKCAIIIKLSSLFKKSLGMLISIKPNNVQ